MNKSVVSYDPHFHGSKFVKVKDRQGKNCTVLNVSTGGTNSSEWLIASVQYPTGEIKNIDVTGLTVDAEL